VKFVRGARRQRALARRRRAPTGSNQSHEDLYRGVHWVIVEGCASGVHGVCIWCAWGVHLVCMGCASLYLPVITGVSHPFTNAHPSRDFECTPLHPWNSGPIQWARGGAKAICRRAPRRPQMGKNKPAHLSLPNDDCLVTEHS